MKKLSTIVMAVALALGMTQCKKNVETIANSASEGVHITLYVGDNGDKHIVHTNTGAVDYTDGDIIYVGNNNKYIGYLTYASGSFSGTISNPSTDDYLHFYFVGGCTPSETPVAGTTTSFSVDISDQSNQMPVLSYVHTKDKYVDGTTTYECMLLNKCGLVKFNLTNTDIPASQNVLITGMNNGATVHFNSSEPFTYSTSGDGSVILNAVSAQERWAVLPVQSEVSGAVAISSGHSNSEAFTVPAITANMYYTTGVNVPEMAVAGTALTFEAKTAGAKVKLVEENKAVSIDISTNDGATWSAYTLGTDITLSNVGDKVMFRATSAGNDWMAYGSFSISNGDCYVYGNVMSLLYQDFAGKTEFPLNSEDSFYGLFTDCSTLYSHTTYPIELPATTLVDGCYGDMFNGCTNLTTAPALPATTLSKFCYDSMFQDCASLTAAPALPATTFAKECYQNMFHGCTSITAAPALDATTLSYGCYTNMFSGCTSLATAPTLPATTLTGECYAYMFEGCTSLITAPVMSATTLYSGCCKSMFEGCTSLTTAPVLLATTLVTECYDSMFSGCTNLSYIKAMFTTTPGSDYTNNWVDGVAANGTFVMNSSAIWYDPVVPTGIGNDAIPTGWTVQTASK